MTGYDGPRDFAWAKTYAKDYWKFGQEAETHLALHLLLHASTLQNCGQAITGIYGDEETFCVRDAGHGGHHHSIFEDSESGERLQTATPAAMVESLAIRFRSESETQSIWYSGRFVGDSILAALKQEPFIPPSTSDARAEEGSE